MNNQIKSRLRFHSFIESPWGCYVGHDSKLETGAEGGEVREDLGGFRSGSQDCTDGVAMGEEEGEDV